MTDWQQLAAVVGVLGGVAVTLRFLYKIGKAGVKKLRTNMFGIGDLKVDIEALSEQVKFVVTEMKPNGGASVRDCLNRIELRQVLQEQRQWAILSDMSVGVFEADAEGEFVRVNRKYLRMTGRSPEEVIGTGWINTIALRDRERVEAEWHTAIAEEREFESEFMLITPDDERVQVSARTYRLVNETDNTFLGVMGMLTPLDEHGKPM